MHYVFEINANKNNCFLIPGSILCTQEKTLFYTECKLGDLNANWIPILSVSIFASYNFTPFFRVPYKQGYIDFLYPANILSL